jgi:beta-lactamase superfamily II metal-dependent hydrolase
VAKRNNFNQPGEDLLNRLAEENITLFSTADRGTVIIKTDGRKIKIETMLN